MILCPDCHSCKIKKNGHTHYGKQNHKCNECGRQFVLNKEHTIDEYLREIIRRALMERVSLRAICRMLGISLTWLLDFAVQTWSEAPEDLDALSFDRTPDQLQITGLQLDEMRQHCYVETDRWEAFRSIIPFENHWIGKTYTFYIESLFSAVRARVSRLVRRSKSFSKNLENHEAAIRYFFWQWNLSRQPYI